MEDYGALVQTLPMLNTDQVLERLAAKGVRNIDIAKALGLPDSRVPEIKTKKRKLTLDEGAKLIEAFSLDAQSAASQVEPLHPRTSRLLVQYVAAAVGKPLDPESPEAQEMFATIEAFSRFVADPQVRANVDAAESFFRAMTLRSQVAAEDRPQTDPENAH